MGIRVLKEQNSLEELRDCPTPGIHPCSSLGNLFGIGYLCFVVPTKGIRLPLKCKKSTSVLEIRPNWLIFDVG